MYSLLNFLYFGVVWPTWSFLCLLAPKKGIGRFTGWVTTVQAWIARVIPAYLLPTGAPSLGG